MQNLADYQEGWTTKYFDEDTGQTYSGGAARNKRLSKSGGCTGIINKGQNQAIAEILPIFHMMERKLNHLQTQLNEQTRVNGELAKHIQAAFSTSSTRRTR